MRRYLLVANQTLGGGHLAKELEGRMREGPCSVHIVVPATPPARRWTYTDGEAMVVARERLEAAIDRLRVMGVEVDGEVGDPRPMDAIRDALRAGQFDGILLSTLPAGRSKWLKMDLPARVRAEFGLPVRHLIGTSELSVNGRERPGRQRGQAIARGKGEAS